MDMDDKELIEKFISFFKTKGHSEIPSASLIPENDPTVLFTTAGMHPLVPFLLGQKHPLGKRLVNVQKCLRTDDIDEIGDKTHHTFFEMLGNWSIGDYFKKEAIEWSYEFLTGKQWLNIPKDKLAVSCFAGDSDAEKDIEAYEIWKGLGFSDEKIAFLPKKDNWWGPAGKTGPCGPDTEIFYWSGNSKAPEKFNPEDKGWVEIWNNVFMQYSKNAEGKYAPLKQKNVDTGMGLERTLAVLSGIEDNYKTSLFFPIIQKIEGLSGKRYDGSEEIKKAMRIIADHLRASVFIIGEDKGIAPSNLDQGYISRRLIRRAIRYGKQIGIENDFCAEIAKAIIEIYSKRYNELKRNETFILNEMKKEEQKFKTALEKGLNEFNKISKALKEEGKNEISGKIAFRLYDTNGFPLELTEELAREKGFSVDKKGFYEAYEAHQEISRKGAEQKFKSGLADHSDKTVRLHTATHLLHSALRKVLGESVKQRGSNITPERLRFDFSYGEKLTEEQIKKIEEFVNDAIIKKIEVKREELNLEDAKKSGAIGLFEGKYSDVVSVYSIEGFSKEMCTGPHVKNTGEIGKFKIAKEEAVASGVRRIKAIVE